MTIRPLYEPRILEMSLEKYAEVGIDAGIWLAGEWLAQGRPADCIFVPDDAYYFKPRHHQTVIDGLSQAKESWRHEVFIEGFLRAPNNGAQETFRRLLVTHTEMLNEAFRLEWRRRFGKLIDVRRRPGVTATVANQPLHKLIGPR